MYSDRNTVGRQGLFFPSAVVRYSVLPETSEGPWDAIKLTLNWKKEALSQRGKAAGA